MHDETSGQQSSDVDLVVEAARRRLRPMIDPVTGPTALDVEIFDPPLCCPTGLCGPVLDTTLVDLGEAINALQADGRTVVRHMMTADPQAFMRNREVYQLIRERQLAVLPITVVRGRIVKTDAYASLDEMRCALETQSVPASAT
jgi:Arsenical resistance operon protein ArsD